MNPPRSKTRLKSIKEPVATHMFIVQLGPGTS